MIDWSKRSEEPEIMDDFNCEGEVVSQTLKEIETINHLLGGNKVTINGMDLLLKRAPQQSTVRVLDLGCGSGEMLKKIHHHLLSKNVRAELTGIDANPFIVNEARINCKGYDNIKIEAGNAFDEKAFSQNYDIITSTLFTHHLTSAELLSVLPRWKEAAHLGIVINDLHRHPLAYHSIKWITKLLSRSKMVRYDAPLSVLRGFRRKEWDYILKAIRPEFYRVSWKWAFRWEVIIFNS
jgi:SAM-dependent methyltransferase